MQTNDKRSSTTSGSTPAVSVIPRPTKMTVGEDVFTVEADTVIVTDAGSRPEAEFLSRALQPATGFALPVVEAGADAPKTNCIVMTLDPSLDSLGEEGYRLVVTKDRVKASALRPAGVFYAGQTIRQLLPVEILKSDKVAGVPWRIPGVTIEDQPRFPWRGQLFDCCRHFFEKETVKRAIDLLALHKMNRLHWHITEDQGWRLEIKRYPKLTEVGAWRKDKDTGERYGGFYTQDDVREILAYAAERHVEVVPEVEMPGHSMAALASYPWLGCTGGPYTVGNWWGVFKDVYCAGDESTYVFIENVLDEVLNLFPSQYIHIGGDECPKDSWKECPKCQTRIRAEGLNDEHELQSYFVKRIDTYLTERGRRLVGWDEILEGGLAPGAVVQSWRGVKGGIQAAQEKHDVIMSPTSHCYLDYSYMTTSVEKSYSYEPIPEELTAEEAKHVLGVEGNMWTEWVPNRDRLDFQVYPRLTALSEVGWSPKDARDWKDFEARLASHLKRLEILGVKYGVDELALSLEDTTLIGRWRPDRMSEQGVELEWDASQVIDGPGKFDVFLVYFTGTAGIQIDWVALLQDGTEIQRDTHLGWSGINKRDIRYSFDLKEHLPGSKYTIKAGIASQGGTDSSGEVRMRKVE